MYNETNHYTEDKVMSNKNENFTGTKNGVVYQNGKPICETFSKHGGRTNNNPIPEREKEKQ